MTREFVKYEDILKLFCHILYSVCFQSVVVVLAKALNPRGGPVVPLAMFFVSRARDSAWGIWLLPHSICTYVPSKVADKIAAMEAEERRKGEKVRKVVNCLHIWSPWIINVNIAIIIIVTIIIIIIIIAIIVIIAIMIFIVIIAVIQISRSKPGLENLKSKEKIIR